MKVDITNREFSALNSAVDDWETNCESADESYCKAIRPDINALRRIIKRYKERQAILRSRPRHRTTVTNREPYGQ